MNADLDWSGHERKGSAMTHAPDLTPTAPLAGAQVLEHPAVLGFPNLPAARTNWAGILGFITLVLIPTGLAAWYLFTIAEDRFASRTAFSVRSNDMTAPVEIFGAVTQLGTSSAVTDGQIIYDFINSQPMLELARERLPLEDIYNRHPTDRLYALGSDRAVEDILWHWKRMVDVSLDPSSGILTVEARAFTAEDARAIAVEVLSASGALVNQLSEGAREDAIRHAEGELGMAEARLRQIRTRLRTFRDIEQEVDPTQNAQAALGLVATLEEEQARAQVRLDSLNSVLDGDAPRLRALRREIDTLDQRISQERTRLGTGERVRVDDARPLSEVVGEFEELVVDREFAEQAYTLALATYEQAQADARRQSRHLAVHIPPTLSEEAEYPDRPVLLGAIFGLCLAFWGILTLIIANIRERR